MPEILEIEAGRSLSIPIRVNRAGHGEPLAVHSRGCPPGVTIPDVTIARGQDQARVVAHAGWTPPRRPCRWRWRRAGVGPRRRRVPAPGPRQPGDAAPHAGHTLLACGRPAEAVAAFTKAIEAGVSDPFVYNNRGLAYFVAQPARPGDPRLHGGQPARADGCRRSDTTGASPMPGAATTSAPCSTSTRPSA